MIIDPYDAQLARRLEAIVPGLSQDLKRLPELAEPVAVAALRELLACACQATHDRAISLGKDNLVLLPQTWLEPRLPVVIRAQLNLDDDWEFRRLLELLHKIGPTLMAPYIRAGLSSENPEVREAAKDYVSGRYGPVPGLQS